MIDTLRYTKELQKAGLNAKQAESLVRCQVDMMNQNVATKSDLKELEFTLRDEMRDMRSHFEGKFGEIEAQFHGIDGEFRGIEGKFREIEGRFREIEGKFKDLENRMTIKLGSIMAIGVGLILSSNWF